MRYNCEFYDLLGKNRKHKSKSFVPDVRTKRYGYLISIRDMCFECETLVSLPRWVLDLICTIYVRLLISLLFSNGTQMKFNVSPRRDWGVRWISLFQSQGDFYRKETKLGAGLGSWGSMRREEDHWKSAWQVPPYVTMACCPRFPTAKYVILSQVSFLMAEAVAWFHIWNLTEREPANHCCHPYIKCIILSVFWFPPIHLQGALTIPSAYTFQPAEYCGAADRVRSWCSCQPLGLEQQSFLF